MSGGWRRYACDPQEDATLYEIARSSMQDFAWDCTMFTAVDSSCTDAEVPDLGDCLYYLMRPLTPYAGTWGAGLAGGEMAPRPLGETWSGVKRLDPDIETIVGKALEKDADRRYASAAALAEDVARHLTSQPILARPPSTIYQLRKFARRNRALVGGVAATFAVLVAGIVISTVLGLREAAQRRTAVAWGTCRGRIGRFEPLGWGGLR